MRSSIRVRPKYHVGRLLKRTLFEISFNDSFIKTISNVYSFNKQDYFCLNEYKKQTDPEGSPSGQVLIAMLVAQDINKDGKIAYTGAIDNNDSFRKDTVKGAKNYVAAALDVLLQTIEVPVTKPYGCSIKISN